MRIVPLLALVSCCAALAACGDDETTTTSVTALDFQPEPCPRADSPPNITDVTSYGADCGAVEDAMSRIGAVATNFKLGDFSCERTRGSELAGIWTCSGEATYFTFQFAD